MNFASIVAQNEVRDCEVPHLDPTSALQVDSIWRPFRARRAGWSVPRVETLG
jgi:hypothetical protein